MDVCQAGFSGVGFELAPFDFAPRAQAQRDNSLCSELGLDFKLF